MLEQAVYAGRNHTFSLAVALALLRMGGSARSRGRRRAGSRSARRSSTLVAGPDGGAWVGIERRRGFAIAAPGPGGQLRHDALSTSRSARTSRSAPTGRPGSASVAPWCARPRRRREHHAARARHEARRRQRHRRGRSAVVRRLARRRAAARDARGRRDEHPAPTARVRVATAVPEHGARLRRRHVDRRLGLQPLHPDRAGRLAAGLRPPRRRGAVRARRGRRRRRLVRAGRHAGAVGHVDAAGSVTACVRPRATAP